ncbi:MAG TPA: gamma-glutamylcyclotransferase family protein [Polyangiaceae bacterium]|nr:gamma-glutamylcyclotransferase family protein [Polyangiaceae bacterium]
MSAPPSVWVFFYGSYMNRGVLAEVGLAPARSEVARLDGYAIRIAPRANLIRSEAESAWGVLATATHAELDRLYAHARDVLGELYLPEAVLARAASGDYRPALCYLCPAMRARPAEAAYVERIVAPARALGFPAEYVERLASFRPGAARRARAGRTRRP